MKFKVCGLRDPENIRQILRCPIDFIGFVFYRKSPRFIYQEQLKPLNEISFGHVKKVGVFVEPDMDEVQKINQDFELDSIQLHGKVSLDFCKLLKETFPKKTIFLSIGVENERDFEGFFPYRSWVEYFLLDTKTTQFGFGGRRFDWNLLLHYSLEKPFLLAGGIGLENVEEINKIKHSSFWGIDLNSKFEEKPAFKNVEKVKQFLKQLK